jgi:hypothetical protein
MKRRVALHKLETLLLRLMIFFCSFGLKINLLSMHPLRVGRHKGGSFKSTGA